MKIIINIIILLTFININELISSDKNWILVDSTIDANDYYLKMKCCDSLNCIIWNNYFNHGFSFRSTTDGGMSWKNIYYNSNSFIEDIAYPNEKLFIAVGDSGIILRTTDKGENWNKIAYDKNIKFGYINMKDENFGFLCGCTGNCLYGSDLIYFETIDGGKTLQKLDMPIMLSINDLNMLNRNIFSVTGRVITTNLNWKVYFISSFNNWKSFDTLNVSEPNVSCLSSIDTNKVWLAGGFTDFNYLPNTTQIIINTFDGGKTWITQRNQKKNSCPIFAIKFIDENYGMATSCDGLVLMTTNGGKNWIENTILKLDYTSGLDYALDNLQMPTKHTAYVTCSGYYVYKFTGDWPTDVPEPQKPNNFTIFPNPVESELTINFPPEYQTSAIKIYTVEGIEVLESEYKDKIDVSGFTPGVYYIMIKDKVLRFIKL